MTRIAILRCGKLPSFVTWDVPNLDELFEEDNELGAVQDTFLQKGWQSVILKPTVGLGGSYSHRAPLDDLDGTLTKLRVSRPHQEYLIQPFIKDVVTEGEWSFIYFNRQLSHVLLKKPARDDYRVQSIYGGAVRPAEPQPRDLAQAEMVMAKLPFDVLYARLDFVRVAGHLSVIEVELIEPIFSFNLAPESIERLVNATQHKFGMHG